MGVGAAGVAALALAAGAGAGIAMGLELGGVRGAGFLVRLGLRLLARAARSCLARSCASACCWMAAQVLSLMTFHMPKTLWAFSISAIRMALPCMCVCCVGCGLLNRFCGIQHVCFLFLFSSLSLDLGLEVLLQVANIYLSAKKGVRHQRYLLGFRQN